MTEKACPKCGKMITQPDFVHIYECIGTEPATPNYRKSSSVVENLYYHEPATVREDMVLEREKDTVVVFTGDWHFGNSATDHAGLINDLNFVREIKDVNIVLMGDLIDNYIPDAPLGGQHDAHVTPRTQKQAVVHVSRSLKGKVIAVLQGCHEEWSYKRDDFIFSDFLAQEIDAANFNFGGLIHCGIGKYEYTIGVAHKFRGGYANPMGPGKKMYEAIGPFDVGVTAHVHRPSRHRFPIQGRFLDLLVCGSYKPEDRYAMRLSLTPSIGAMPCVILHANKRKVSAYMDVKDALPELKSLSLVSRRLVDLIDDEMEQVSEEKRQAGIDDMDVPYKDEGDDEG